jgi:peroxiredoxin
MAGSGNSSNQIPSPNCYTKPDLLTGKNEIMKYKLLFSAALLLAGMATDAQTNKTLDLQGETPVSSGTVYLQRFDNKTFNTIDSAVIKNGKFSFRTKLQLPELYGLSLNTAETPLYIFLDQSKVKVKLDSARYYSASVVSGSALQDQFNQFKDLKDVDISEYIKAHPASLVSAYILYRNYAYRLTADEIEENIQLLDTSLYRTPYIKSLREYKEVLANVAVGKKAPDFTANDTEGRPVKLSDNYHKYTLIDFWASWCGPCRRENPNVVAAFRKYKDKGFSVFGVSLDKSKEGWIKAIEKDQLDWKQVSELTYWKSEIAKTYGVRAIPANFLIDENGIIVAKNLRGEKLLQKLDELFNQQQ